MSPRPSLRNALLAALAAGAVLVPATSAFADSAPAKPSSASAEPSAARPAASAEPAQSARPSAVPRGGVAAGDRPSAAPSAVPATAPRGGVAAGERPAGGSNDGTAALVGTALGAVLVAGAGTVVLRRRSAAARLG